MFFVHLAIIIVLAFIGHGLYLIISGRKDNLHYDDWLTGIAIGALGMYLIA